MWTMGALKTALDGEQNLGEGAFTGCLFSDTALGKESEKRFYPTERGSGYRRKIAVGKYNPRSRERGKKSYESLMQFNIFS